MIINIDLNPEQRYLMDTLVPLIKKIGDTPKEENANNYIDVINILLEIKKNFLEGNYGTFITKTLPPTHKLTVFDADEKLFKTESLSEIEFQFGEPTPLTPEEIRNIQLSLKDSVVAEAGYKREPIIVDLGKYDEEIAEEKLILRQLKKDQMEKMESEKPVLIIKSKAEEVAEKIYMETIGKNQ